MLGLVSLQPLFPGESGVDQLVEIIKVWEVWSSFFCLGDNFGILHSKFVYSGMILDSWNTNQRRNKVHESKLHRIQVSSN